MAEEWVEQIDRRTRSSKSSQLFVDGQPTDHYMWEGVAGAPLHYPDESGVLQDINTSLVPSTRSITGFGNPAWEMVENEYEAFILNELNSGVPLIRYEAKHTEYFIQFAAMGLEWSNALDQISSIAMPATTPTAVDGSEARWDDCYGSGQHLRFLVGYGRMSKWLDLTSPLADPPQFIIDGGGVVLQLNEILELHRDLEVYINGELWNRRDEVGTTEEIEIRSPDGEVQFVFPVATAHHEGLLTDPENEASTWQQNVLGEMRLKRQGPDLYITMRFPWSWFQTDDFAWPIHLDTTIDKQTAASGDDGQWDTAGNFDATVSWGQIGRSTGQDRHNFARWTGLTIGAGATIDVCTTDWFGHTMSGSGVEMAFFGVDENDPAAPTSAAEADADPLTTAKVDWDQDFSASQWYTSPESKTIMQELYDSWGPFSNEAVMFQLKDDGSGNGDVNAPRHYDFGLNDYGPKLHIEYSTVTGKPRSAMLFGLHWANATMVRLGM